MGGQACVLYGGAEFSRDADIVVPCDAGNLARFTVALAELQAERIAVPPFEPEHLRRGLAVHFRCSRPDVAGIRIDVMSKLRGVDDFADLWERRTTVEMAPGETVELLSLPDLARAKRTQRDKDWPMIRRLVEANYATHRDDPSPQQITFWMREARTPEILVELASRAAAELERLLCVRPLLRHARDGDEDALRQALATEEHAEREADRQYWVPLKAELEQLRRERSRGK